MTDTRRLEEGAIGRAFVRPDAGVAIAAAKALMQLGVLAIGCDLWDAGVPGGRLLT